MDEWIIARSGWLSGGKMLMLVSEITEEWGV